MFTIAMRRQPTPLTDDTLLNSQTSAVTLIVAVVLFVIWFTSSACSVFESDSQYTNKVVAPDFVSELYGSTSQTLSVSHPGGAHITWMGFIQSNNYKYFEITKVQAGSQTIVSDGVEINGEIFETSSNAIVQDISISASDGGSAGYADGSITVAGSGDLKVTVRYSPLVPIDSSAEPHEAYLIINYDEPKAGSVRIRLTGYTQGVKAEKCTQAVSTMDVIEYQIVEAKFDLYFCSGEVAANDQNNTPQDASDPDFHGVSTNIASIAMTDAAFTFYQVDDETLCLLTEPVPSVNAFILPIPDGLAPIDSMDISLMEGSYAECSLDAEGNILCPDNIQIDALVSLSGFGLSNQGYAAEELVADDCPDFGAINGAGLFGEETMTLILKGNTLADQNTEAFNIVDSLIVAVIRLEK